MSSDSTEDLKPDAVRTSPALGTRPPPSAVVYGLPANLGAYTLVERLGVGGMAEVFRATKESAGGVVTTHVVKRCLPHLAEDRRFIEMFLREARMASLLRHANVVQVHELGHIGNTYFLVLEFVDGLTLRKLAARAWSNHKAMPMELIVSAIADAALGLHHAHTMRGEDGSDLGIVHRDVSPENLMIDRDGHTKVLDFGIARARDGGMLTKTGELKGKIPFMAPEHIKGEPLDGRADVYALGVTMYWLLTGRRPHHAPTELVLLNEILFSDIPPPNTINPLVPPDVSDLVMAMLSRDPSDRPDTALVVHQALATTLQARGSLVAPFVRTIADLTDPTDRGPLSEDDETDVGFVPATPQTSMVLTGWHRLARVGERTPARPGIARPVTLAPPAPAPIDRLRPVVVGAPAVLAVALAAWLSLPPPPIVLDPPAALTVKEAARDPGTVTSDAGVHADAPKHSDGPIASSTQSVTLKGPQSVHFVLAEGVIGRPGRAVDVDANSLVVRAVDRGTGCVHSVPIVAGVADFSRLGKGKLDVRALPYAEVSVGARKLGTTPFSAQELVEGTCEVTFAFEKKREKRTVKIKKGAQQRLQVDFRGK